MTFSLTLTYEAENDLAASKQSVALFKLAQQAGMNIVGSGVEQVRDPYEHMREALKWQRKEEPVLQHA